MKHELKCWPEYFAAILDGLKTWEVRKDDRGGFNVGDELELREWTPPPNSCVEKFANGETCGQPREGHYWMHPFVSAEGQYTGRKCLVHVIYTMSLRCCPGYVGMTIEDAVGVGGG